MDFSLESLGYVKRGRAEVRAVRQRRKRLEVDDDNVRRGRVEVPVLRLVGQAEKADERVKRDYHSGEKGGEASNLEARMGSAGS